MLVSDTRKGYEDTKEKIITVFYAKKGCALVFARIPSWFYVEGITNLENKLVQKKSRRFEKHTSRDTKIFDFKRSLSLVFEETQFSFV